MLRGISLSWAYSLIEPLILYNNQINASALIGQAIMGYCAGGLRKNHASSELLYKSNTPKVSMGYRLINHMGCW